MTPISVNFHLLSACDAECTFCFATFRDVPGHLSTTDALHLIDRLRAAGAEKINFAGGEPTLHRDIGRLVSSARKAGLVTSIISNGARLRPLIEKHAADLDWVGLSVDSAREDVQAALGRGRGDHVRRSVELFDLVHARGLRAKLNTVVTALNCDEDMSAFVRRARPDRWKVFQVLPIGGQNDGRVEPLLISPDQFRAFVARHAALRPEGLGPVAEDNDSMTDSYVMVDPLGRFYSNATGRHVYSAPILEVGVEAALAQVGWDAEKFVERGGLYDWASPGSGVVQLRSRRG
ncbi:MAG: viperin family antiviral radical SAM protein [Myxococcota bacterium]